MIVRPALLARRDWLLLRRQRLLSHQKPSHVDLVPPKIAKELA